MRSKGAKGITYPDQRWARCDLKTVNLLGPVLARQAAAEAGAYEAILHRDGMVMEGAATNCFVVVGGVLRTAPLSNYILPGITRSVLLPLAAELGIKCEERAITLRELPSVDELFVCGTTTDVQAIVTLDGAPIGAGAPGCASCGSGGAGMPYAAAPVGFNHAPTYSGAGIPHDSMLLHSPTVIPPGAGQPRIEIDPPKPMPMTGSK